MAEPDASPLQQVKLQAVARPLSKLLEKMYSVKSNSAVDIDAESFLTSLLHVLSELLDSSSSATDTEYGWWAFLNHLESLSKELDEKILRSATAQGTVTPAGMAGFAGAELPTGTVTTTTMPSALTQLMRPTSYVAVSSSYSAPLPANSDAVATQPQPVQPQEHAAVVPIPKEARELEAPVRQADNRRRPKHPPILAALAPVSASVKRTTNSPQKKPSLAPKKDPNPPMLAPVETCLTEQEALECTQGLADACHIGMLDALELEGVDLFAIVMMKEDLVQEITLSPCEALPVMWAKILSARIGNQQDRGKYIRFFLAICAKRATFTGTQQASRWASCGATQLHYHTGLPEFSSCLTAYNTGDVMLLRAELIDAPSVLRTSKLAFLILLGGELCAASTQVAGSAPVDSPPVAPPKPLATSGAINSIWRHSPEKSAVQLATTDKLFNAAPVRRYGGNQMVAWMSDEKGSDEN